MKRYLRQNLDFDEIITLKVSKLEVANKQIFKWIHSKEFRYRGAMYDLVPNYSTLEDENYFIFKVVNDVREEQLLAKFIGSFANSPYSWLLKNIKYFLFDAVKFISEFDFIIVLNSLKFHNHIFDILSNYLLIDSPPPKSIICL